MDVRPAHGHEADALADVFVAARADMTYLPPQPSDDAFRRFIGHKIMQREEVWVAETHDGVVGFLTLAGEMLDHLYVHPEWQSHGVGTKLLDVAKSRRPFRLELWVFQKNERARRLYERQGFKLVELTDGEGTMEREPDARYEWAP